MGIRTQEIPYVNMKLVKAKLVGDAKGTRLARLIAGLEKPGISVRLDDREFMNESMSGFVRDKHEIFLNRSLLSSSSEIIEDTLIHEIKHISSMNKNLAGRTAWVRSSDSKIPIRGYREHYSTDELEARISELANKDYNIRTKNTLLRRLDKKELTAEAGKFLAHQKNVFNKINAETIAKSGYRKGERTMMIPIVDDANREIIQINVNPYSIFSRRPSSSDQSKSFAPIEYFGKKIK